MQNVRVYFNQANVKIDREDILMHAYSITIKVRR